MPPKYKKVCPYCNETCEGYYPLSCICKCGAKYYSKNDIWLERKSNMALEKAKALLDEEYERAKKLEYVRDPVAFALYSVWKKADKEKKSGT